MTPSRAPHQPASYGLIKYRAGERFLVGAAPGAGSAEVEVIHANTDGSLTVRDGNGRFAIARERTYLILEE